MRCLVCYGTREADIVVDLYNRFCPRTSDYARRVVSVIKQTEIAVPTGFSRFSAKNLLAYN